MGERKAEVGQINIVARDFEATVDFYRRVGLELADTPEFGEGMRHCEVVMPGGFTLELDSEASARSYHAGWRDPGGGSRALIGVSLASRDEVDARYAELVGAGFEGRQPPYDAFWGARYAVVADPDGNDVGLMSPIEADRKYWPPGESPALGAE